MEKVQKDLKKKHWVQNLKVIMLSIAIALAIFFVVILLFEWHYDSIKPEVYTNITEYEHYMAREDADERFRNKWGMDETIFPESITDEMMVQDYKMVYYNPWDAMFLGHLVVKYNEEDYRAEVDRLTAYESTEYLGYYGVTGFSEDYTLLAMYADDYQGFVYALTDNENTIVYVEMIFCNYFMDLPYEKYIPAEHLPTGFNAKIDNPYQEMMLNK